MRFEDEEMETCVGMTDYQFEIFLKTLIELVRVSKSKEDAIETLEGLLKDQSK